ncbi:MAG: ACP S-malonyltransferase [Anaerolineales bacterium]|nr:MAG: ACP S-malonyltransferase [Anaerolineales bacterium]
MTLIDTPTAWLFPGQGSQKTGMGLALAQAYPQAAAVFRQADDILGYALSNICWHEPQDVLNETLHTQPALLTHSVAVLRVLEQQIPSFKPQMVAGHSLGEISALVAAGALAFEDAVRLVQVRAESMQYAGEVHPGGMSAILGLPLELVETACEAASQAVEGSVWVANDNCPGQVVISGDDDALEDVQPRLQEAGARRVLRLAVSIAAHSPLMAPAQERFNAAVATAPFQAPAIGVIGNVTGSPLLSIEAIAQDLRAQLGSRVRWTESIQRMGEAGIQTFFEIGSGSVLVGLLRRILPEAQGISLDSPETIQTLVR